MSDQPGVGPALAAIGLVLVVVFVFGVIAEVGVAINDCARRREARAVAEAAMVRAWLDANSHLPLEALWADVPLSTRRIRRALQRLQADAEFGHG